MMADESKRLLLERYQAAAERRNSGSKYWNCLRCLIGNELAVLAVYEEKTVYRDIENQMRRAMTM